MIKVENNRGAEEMKASTKIGIKFFSIAAVASVSVAVIASEKIIKRKVYSYFNRYKVKSL